MSFTPQQKIIISAFGLTNVNVANRLNIPPSPFPGGSPFPGKLPKGNVSDEPKYTSQIGTPVFDTLIFKGGEYTDSTFGKTKYNDFRIDTALMTLTRTNNVILTKIQGRDAEVVEYSSKNAFRINVKGGVFSTTNNNRPVSDIIALKLLLESNQSLVIKECGFLSEWDITEMFILDKTIPQAVGGYDYQLFEFNAVQDIPVILAQSPVNGS